MKVVSTWHEFRDRDEDDKFPNTNSPYVHLETAITVKIDSFKQTNFTKPKKKNIKNAEKDEVDLRKVHDLWSGERRNNTRKMRLCCISNEVVNEKKDDEEEEGDGEKEFEV